MEFCYQNAFEIQNLVGDTRFHVSFEIELPLNSSFFGKDSEVPTGRLQKL